MQVSLTQGGRRTITTVLKDLKKGEWAEASFETGELGRNHRRVDEIVFVIPKGAVLLLDDVLLH